MKPNSGSEFIYQLFALILSFIIVHAIYVAVIRPNADAILQEQLERQAAGEAYVVQRSPYIVMRDYEQEACFVLMFWSIAIMGFKARNALRERSLLGDDIVRDVPQRWLRSFPHLAGFCRPPTTGQGELFSVN